MIDTYLAFDVPDPPDRPGDQIPYPSSNSLISQRTCKHREWQRHHQSCLDTAMPPLHASCISTLPLATLLAGAICEEDWGRIFEGENRESEDEGEHLQEGDWLGERVECCG